MTLREEALRGLPLSCPVIDSHTHIGPYHLSGWHEKYDRTDTASVLEDLGRLGTDCIVTAPHPLVQERMAEANEIAAKAASDFPGKVFGYISIIPPCGIDAVRQELQKHKGNPAFLGLKFLAGYHGNLLQKEYEYAMDFADEMGCPVLLHIYANNPDKNEIPMALKHRHRMQLIVAHQGGAFASETRSCAPIIRDHENASMELCGSLDNSLGTEQIVELVGEDKVIYGTDAISMDAKYELGKVALAPLTDEVKRKIFAGNYLRLLQNSQMGKIQL